MEVSQRIAVSGMLASQRQMEVVSNNLANANTTGFKRAVAHATDVGYQTGPTAPVGRGGLDLRQVSVGEGTQIADISHEFVPGSLQSTGNPLDLALQGDGFFNVALPDGTPGFTRDGSFGIDAGGQLVTSGGLSVQSDTGTNLVVPAGSIQVHLDDTGLLTATDTTGTEVPVGRLGLSQFANSSGLQANGQNVWTSTVTSGAAVAVTQGAPTAPAVVAGALEGSNVDMADEFTRLIQAQRGYQLNSKVVQSWDDIERMADEIRSA